MPPPQGYGRGRLTRAGRHAFRHTENNLDHRVKWFPRATEALMIAGARGRHVTARANQAALARLIRYNAVSPTRRPSSPPRKPGSRAPLLSPGAGSGLNRGNDEVACSWVPAFAGMMNNMIGNA